MTCADTAWFPLIVWSFREALVKGSIRLMIVTGLLLGHSILAGAPQVTVYIMLYLLLYSVYEFLTAGSWKPQTTRPDRLFIWFHAGGVVVIAAALTAIQM